MGRGRTAVRWLVLVGVIGSMVWAFFGYQMLQDRLGSLSRTAVPGQVTVETAGPQTLTIYYEDPTASGRFVVRAAGTSTLTTSPVEITVTGPAGRSTPTTPYGRDLRFTHDGRVVVTMATFDAPTAGDYTIDVSGNAPPGAAVSVGTVVDTALIINGVGAVGLFVISLLSLVATMIAALVSRSRVS